MPLFNPNTAIPANLSVVSKTTTYTATTSDDVILADTSGGAWTLTLYAASGNSGKVLRVVKTTSDTNALTIDGNASETINGFANIKLNYQFDEVTLVCDGTNWNIVSQIKAPTVQTLTSGSGTYTTPNGVKYLKVTVVGGGGGGGAGGGSGGSPGSGTAGGSSTFGTSLLTATGGGGGSPGISIGGAGGTGTINSPAITLINVVGGVGNPGGVGLVNGYAMGGAGGANALGGAGAGAGYTQNGGDGKANTGGGGGGGNSGAGSAPGTASGSGGGAGGYLEALIYNPSSSYNWACGAGGNSGTPAGTGATGGGNAGTGFVKVEEHYQ